MTPFRSFPSRSNTPRSGAFTLIEMLVVLGIILLLSAISFPVFKSVQERGAQTTCVSNLQQTYLAVRLYRDDEREFPASLAMLLPDTETLASPGATAAPTPPGPQPPGPVATAPPGTQSNSGGTGYFRKTREELVCPDDDFQPVVDPSTPNSPVRSSYGDVTGDPTQAGPQTSETIAANSPYTGAMHNAAFYGAGDTRDWGRLVWNYWGYDDWGQAFRTQQEALDYAKANAAQVGPALRDYVATATPNKNTKAPPDGRQGYHADASYSFAGPPAFYFNPRGLVSDVNGNGTVFEEPRAANMFKYSMSNPQAPLGTIITHCVFHRLQTGKNVFMPGANQLYDATTAMSDGEGARDVVLRLDGTARSYDVSKWNNPDLPSAMHGSNWQISDF